MKLKLLSYNFDQHYLPRWSVMVFDQILAGVSLVLTSTILFESFGAKYDILTLQFLGLYCFFSFLAGWLWFKPYVGIIRYFSVNDLIKFSKACLVGSGLLFLFILVHNQLASNLKIGYPTAIALTGFFTTLTVIVASRLMVYYLTHKSSNHKIIQKNILIYGTGNLAIATRNAVLKFEHTFYNVTGFIDDNPLFKNRKIAGLPVYTEAQTEALFRRHRPIDEIFLAADDQENGMQNQRTFVERHMATGLKFKDVPDISHWDEGRLRSNQVREIRIEDILGREPIVLNPDKISEELTGKVIMVTGATGSIGSEIIRQVLKFKPRKMILIDRAESQLFELQHEIMPIDHTLTTDVQFCLCDTTDRYRMEGLFSEHRPELIFHASAYKHVPLLEDNPYEAIRNNVISTKVLADLANQYVVSKFVLISTDKAVNPTNVMGASKRICELYIQSYANDPAVATRFITTRFGNVIGSSGSVIPLFKRQIEKGGPVTITHKEIIRYLMTIPEACQLVLEACSMGNGGEIYLFDMGKPVKIYDLAIKMIQLSGLVPYKDINIREIGLRPGEKLYEELINDMEDFIPTHNSRILIGINHYTGNGHIRQAIEELIGQLNHEGDEELVRRMKQIVPEFVSNNSRFAVLDR